VTRYVVKLGGHALDALEPSSPVLVALAEDIATLATRGVEVAVVHGGGPQIAALLAALGVDSVFHEGLRVTDAATMEYVAMALGQVNVHLVAAFNRAGLVSAGLSGADGTTLRSLALGGPWGRAGATPLVATALVETLWRVGVTPVLSSIAVDEAGGLVNCNADTAAGALAAALDADALVLLSDVDQLRADPGDAATSLARVSAEEVRRLLESGAARDGMRPKMAAALDALAGGARRVVLANGTRPHALAATLDGERATTEVFA
jgi:acetylglutamate kinase